MEGRVRVAIVMLVLAKFCPSEGTNCNLYPAVVVPGTFGSTIEALVKENAKPPINESCSRMGHDWFTLWSNRSLMLFQKQCFLDSITLCYDAYSDDYRSPPGLETRSGPLITDDTDPLWKGLAKISYEDGVSLFGAPYDFRYGVAAEGQLFSVGSQFLQDLKELIENASASNGDKPVILVPLSYGVLFALQLLNRNSLSWRQRYIKHFVPVAAPWGGTVRTMVLFASGLNELETFNFSHLEIRDTARSWESTLWTMPNPGEYAFSANTTLVMTPTANYTAYNMSQFIQDTTGHPDAACRYESRILPLVKNLTAPEVNVTSIISTNVSTPEMLIYNETGFDQPSKIVTGDGDQLVKLVSALKIQSACKQIENQPTPKIITLPGKSHGAIFVDDDAIK